MRTCYAILDKIEELRAGGDWDGCLVGTLVELHYDMISDLLAKNKHDSCCIYDENYIMHGANYLTLDSKDKILKLAAKLEDRVTRGTKMNDTSSRSHCMATLTLVQRRKNETEKSTCVSSFTFCDLMGSERFKGDNSAH